MLAGAAALGALAAGWWAAGEARAEVGGYSQVSRLELAYVPDGQALRARVTLVGGQALTSEATSDRDARTLLEMAQVFSQKGTRMFVEVKNGSIVSFQVSIP
jgi:hypothetical protein